MLNITIYNLEPESCSRYSASAMGLKGPVFESWQSKRFFPSNNRPHRLQDRPIFLFFGKEDYFPEGKAAGADAERLSPPSTKVKSKWI
jgi:hypothetical protein